MKPTFTLPSPETGTTYQLYAEAPRVAPRQPLGVIYFLDGDNQFAAAVAAYRALRARGAIPPLLLVGVGYGASYGQPANRRARDYTPAKHPGIPEGGGADAFLRFFTGPLWRELKRRHRVDSKLRVIAGHSLGSLLVLHALFQPRPWFTHHLASAPPSGGQKATSSAAPRVSVPVAPPPRPPLPRLRRPRLRLDARRPRQAAHPTHCQTLRGSADVLHRLPTVHAL